MAVVVIVVQRGEDLERGEGHAQLDTQGFRIQASAEDPAARLVREGIQLLKILVVRIELRQLVQDLRYIHRTKQPGAHFERLELLRRHPSAFLLLGRQAVDDLLERLLCTGTGRGNQQIVFHAHVRNVAIGAEHLLNELHIVFVRARLQAEQVELDPRCLNSRVNQGLLRDHDQGPPVGCLGYLGQRLCDVVEQLAAPFPVRHPGHLDQAEPGFRAEFVGSGRIATCAVDPLVGHLLPGTHEREEPRSLVVGTGLPQLSHDLGVIGGELLQRGPEFVGEIDTDGHDRHCRLGVDLSRGVRETALLGLQQPCQSAVGPGQEPLVELQVLGADLDRDLEPAGVEERVVHQADIEIVHPHCRRTAGRVRFIQFQTVLDSLPARGHSDLGHRRQGHQIEIQHDVTRRQITDVE